MINKIAYTSYYQSEIIRRAEIVRRAGIKDQLLKMFGIDKIKKIITVLVKAMVEEGNGQNLGAQASFRRKAGASDLVKRTLGNKAWILKTLGNAGMAAGTSAIAALVALVVENTLQDYTLSQKIVDALSKISGADGESTAAAIIIGLFVTSIVGIAAGKAIHNKGNEAQGKEDDMKERYYREHPEKRPKSPDQLAKEKEEQKYQDFASSQG